MPRLHCSEILLLFAYLISLLPSLAQGQTTWEGDDLTNPELWSAAENWSNGIPNSSTTTTVGSPAPTIVDVVSASAQTLEVLVGGEIEILGGKTLTIHGTSLINNGLITINSDNSTDLATLTFNTAGGTIDGSGEIVLGAISDDARLNNINKSNPVTHQVDHTIRGEGQIPMSLINFGTITASEENGDSTAELLIRDGAKTNHGTIQSSSTASLRLAVSLTQGSTGQLIADTSTVFVNNINITGGTLKSVNGGVFQTSGNALTFDTVDELQGQFNLVSGGGVTGNLLVKGGGFTNNGTILINRDNVSGSQLRFTETGTLDGTGEVILNSPGLGATITTSSSVGTFGSNQTIRGIGQIQGEIVNNGLILAETRNGGTELLLNARPKTNNGTIRAEAGAAIGVLGATITQDDTTGVMLANGGTIALQSSSVVQGGRLDAVGGGKVTVEVNGRLQDVVNDAPIEIPTGNNTLTLAGTTFVNNNTITNGSNLAVDGNVEISGAGEIVLDSTGNASINVVSGFTATLGSGQILRRTAAGNATSARVNGPGVFINNGRAEGASSSLLLNFNGRVGGSGAMKDVNITSVHAPGDPGGTAQVSLEGVYNMTIFGTTLEMDLGGTVPGSGYDQLISTDPMNLITIGSGNTKLNVSFLPGYFPTNGDIFTLVDIAGTITGNFSQINLPPLPSGFNWLDISTPQTIAYQFIAPLAGDFEEDGDVDGDDLTRWQTNYGTGSTHMQGDADDDQDVDGRDFLIWQRQYSGPLPTPVAVVPEPTTYLLLVGAIFAIVEMRLTKNLKL